MAPPDLDTRIAALYQQPLDEFTRARNALAKELGRPGIKKLDKPNIAAWAVNQLYWRERAIYDAVIKSAEQLRAEHRKLLSGKASAIRDAEQAHRDAIREAIVSVQTILQQSGQSATDATVTAVRETLEALPSDAPPGQLTRPLKPMGFEALAGIKPQASARHHASGTRPHAPVDKTRKSAPLTLVKSASDAKRERDEAKRRERDERERKDRQKQAEKSLKTAEAAMLRAEDAVKKAEKTLAALRAKRDEAVSAYQRARLRARE